MKKALSIATAITLMLSLAACGSSAASSSAAPAADSTASSTAESSSAAESTGDKKDLTFGYIAYDMSDIWNEYSAKHLSMPLSRMALRPSSWIPRTAWKILSPRWNP